MADYIIHSAKYNSLFDITVLVCIFRNMQTYATKRMQAQFKGIITLATLRKVAQCRHPFNNNADNEYANHTFPAASRTASRCKTAAQNDVHHTKSCI